MKKGGIGRGFWELLRELPINLLHFLDGTHLDHYTKKKPVVFIFDSFL